MDVRSLRYAVTLAETLHFGRAARAHYIAAQPFGRHIRALEREVGTPLFARTSRRVVLTPAGERFLPRARRVLAQLDGLVAQADGPREDSGVLRIGVLGFGLADLWPGVRDLVEARCPDLVLTAVELDWEGQYDAVRTGEVDVALVHDVGGADDLALDRTLELERYAVVPVRSELAGAETLTGADIERYRWVSPVGSFPGLAEWRDHSGLRGGVAVRSPSGIPTAVATSGWLGLHAEPARRFFPHPEVRYVPLEGPAATISVASRPSDRREAVTVFRAAARAVAAADLRGAAGSGIGWG
ncbi:LysR family transcriptional regulator [Pseudonocardia endophytica]|uniref:DNA-binding transcriptional LysR family regulator n=1 Tax=Pseudonocardia endophytica TaxID=401976 RepID=A0A4R1HUE2_PSEEN|nr:LysR family transcriptional regulator [Pseudonocardia endophytica]TCK24565.1 DNA-binding transcriptional LysR family regulator [Pseudonocardia endophytica]